MTTKANALTAFYDVLQGFAGLQALVTNLDSPATYRIYAVVLPQDSVYPSVTYQNANSERMLTMSNSGGGGVLNLRIRVSSWANTLSDASEVAEQVRLALKAATTLQALQVVEFDQYEIDTKLYQTVSDYSVWYK